LPPAEPTLTVDRAEFGRGIRLVTKEVDRKLPIEVRFDYAEGQLRLHGHGAVASLPAKGTWGGSAFVSGRALGRLASRLPRTPLLKLGVKAGRLYIGTFAFSARWQDLGPSPVTLPIGASGLDVLTVDAAHPRAVVASSGLEQAVEMAQAELERRTAEAAGLLSSYGVKAEDLQKLVQKKIIARSKTLLPEPDPCFSKTRPSPQAPERSAPKKPTNLPVSDEEPDTRSLFLAPPPKAGPPLKRENPLALKPVEVDPDRKALWALKPPKPMLLVADPADGLLLPEFREEWEPRLHYFYAGCLLPEWWPEDGTSGFSESPQERLDDFEANLEAVLSSGMKIKGTTSATVPSLMPQSVLNSLLLLHSALVPEPIRPAPD